MKWLLLTFTLFGSCVVYVETRIAATFICSIFSCTVLSTVVCDTILTLTLTYVPYKYNKKLKAAYVLQDALWMYVLQTVKVVVSVSLPNEFSTVHFMVIVV